MAMDRARRRAGSKEYDQAIARGREWIEGLQSRDGGWAAFDVNNLEYYLNNIPFSDHGALLDPADRGRHRALHLDAGAARRNRGDQQDGRGWDRLSASVPSSRKGRGTAAGA